jgi:MFS family permease
MNQDLGLSQTAFGLGAGIFFIAYFIFEVPSNLLLEQFGARKWIARIMLSWGMLSGTMAFIPAIAHATGLGNENSFYLLRVLLGAAEAGFFPGIIFYLTLWFPAQYRARIVGYFMAAIPLSTVIGAAISAIFFLFAWRPRSRWLAVAVHHRGRAGSYTRWGGIPLSHRSTCRRGMARTGRTQVARRPTGT